jgi:integrase
MRPWRGASELRHTHATLLLAAGVHPKVVQERLGHSSVQISLDVYSHATKGMQDDAAAFIGSLVLGARDETRRQNADISAEVADFSASTDA